ncbi:ATPase, AAA-type, core, P-loop containing nucleoside triphosphate hydrolase [Tanacetum coccineum]
MRTIKVGRIVVGLPDQEGRQKIFDIYMRNVPMQEVKEKICDYVAQHTEGLVVSDLKEIADESKRLAAHRDGEFVTFDDVVKLLIRPNKTTKLSK